MKTILNYKKPAFWIIVAVIATCVAVAVVVDARNKKYCS